VCNLTIPLNPTVMQDQGINSFCLLALLRLLRLGFLCLLQFNQEPKVNPGRREAYHCIITHVTIDKSVKRKTWIFFVTYANGMRSAVNAKNEMFIAVRRVGVGPGVNIESHNETRKDLEPLISGIF